MVALTDGLVIERLATNPIIRPQDVQPSRPGMEVLCAFNAGALRVDDEFILLLRVAERPLSGSMPDDAMILDLHAPEPKTRPATGAESAAGFVAFSLLDLTASTPGIATRYLPRDLPGLDLTDPRSIRYAGQTFLTSISHLRLARSRDGVAFRVDPQPALAPATAEEEFGCEDPRLTRIGDTFYLAYTAVSRYGIGTALARSPDLQHFERLGVAFYPENRDVALFPEQIGGRYVALHRPQPRHIGPPTMWLGYSTDLRLWGDHRFLMAPRPGMWDSKRIGGGAVPFRVPEGWLELYHGVDEADRYCLGAVLLDGEQPGKVLARSPRPFLEPEAPFEREGLLGNVVFTCGAVPLDDGRMRLYYGAADSVTGAADLDVKALLATLT
jgi:beta-1,2-mannobiose phosphorylase / 1,2-beta-oligomannan phosphorylase